MKRKSNHPSGICEYERRRYQRSCGNSESMLEKIESVSNILERKKEQYIISNGENKKITLLILYTALLYLCMQKDYWIQKCLLQ